MTSLWVPLAQAGLGVTPTPAWVWTWWAIAALLVIGGTALGGWMFGTWRRVGLRWRERHR
jgi:hypothetical protein